MSLHIGDYKKDTGNLRSTGHGAYLLLIMHYWSTGALPDDDRQLAAIAGMSDREWKQWKPTLQAFFHDGWKHKRIDAELELAQKNYDVRAAAGSKGGMAKAQQKGSNATANDQQKGSNAGSKRPANGQQNCSPGVAGPATATLTLTNKDSLRESSRARARESENPSVLKEESEARKEKRARVQADTPQWDAWQKHLKAQNGKGSPCDKRFGWYFPTEWPPGYQP
jgi:uncharacterized protein YdaU (DUF1376 family)